MRVKDFVRMYHGFARVGVEIYASVTVFNEEFEMVNTKIYPIRKENYLSEEVTGYDIVNGKIRLMIRGCE